MAKTIIKEIIIILLLCLAIIVILGLLLYDYVPMSKVVPEPVSYSTPEDVKQELIEAGSVDEDEIIMTYEVDSTDLNNYKNIKDYKPGKANPFSSYETTVTTNSSASSGTASSSSGTTANGNGTTTNNSNTGSNAENTTTSGGKFFQDKGTK